MPPNMVLDRFVRFSRAVVNWNEKAKGVEVVLLEETNEARSKIEIHFNC